MYGFYQAVVCLLPNWESMFMKADTIKVMTVHAIIQMKKLSYPNHSCILPEIIPGSIMPRDMKAVDIAKCAVGYLPRAKYIIYKV